MLLIISVSFHASICLGQQPVCLGPKPVIFEFHATRLETPGLQVPNFPSTTISHIDNNSFTFTEDFYSSESGLALKARTFGSDGPGSCAPYFPLCAAAGTAVFSERIPLMEPNATSFSTIFKLSSGPLPSDNGSMSELSFIITSNTSEARNGSFAVDGVAVNMMLFGNRTFVIAVQNSTISSIPLVGLDGELSFVVWLEYDGLNNSLQAYVSKFVDATDIAFLDLRYFIKPPLPVASVRVDLANAFLETKDGMLVGFSGTILNSLDDITVVLWTFHSNGLAPDVTRNADGSYDADGSNKKMLHLPVGMIVGITIVSAAIFCTLMYTILVLQRRNARLTELAKKYDIDLDALQGPGPQMFKYRVLSAATNGFSDKHLLGTGAFGSVYRGNLELKGKKEQTKVAVKRISATSDQGAVEFQAEVKIIGQLQHRNTVRLLGWCYDRGELLLVYEHMPNGSVDQFLYSNTKEETVLTWIRRLRIMSGVASAVAFLHQDWEKQVIHRDLKSSNVMLDHDFNARLGDFGLARDHEHGKEAVCTKIAGTRGYLAPELAVTYQPTEKTDVYSFGAMVLELATGRKPMLSEDDKGSLKEVFLVDWVWSLYEADTLLDAADARLLNTYDPREMVKFLKIGLLCCHTNPQERPTMRDVMNIWRGKVPFPHLPRKKPVLSFHASIGTTGLIADHDIDDLPLFADLERSADLSQAYDAELSLTMNDGNCEFLAVEVVDDQKVDTPDSRLRHRGSAPLHS
jgi:serine/threonine protein kinase